MPALARAGGAAEIVRPVPPVKLPRGPQDRDPRFQQALKKLDQSAAGARKHAPASAKVAQAQAAALPPPDEKLAGARANQVSEMNQAETPKPEATNFRAMLRAEIQKVMPKKVEEGRDFMKGGDRQQLKGAMTANVEQQKGEATAGIEQAKNAPPDTSSVPGKPVTPMPGEPPAPAPAPVGAAQAMPPPAAEKDVSLEQGKKSTDQLMKDNELTSTQMEKANDPRFSRVNAEKAKADQFADSAPQKYRATEQGIGAKASAEAAAQESRSLLGMKQVQGAAATAVRARQLTAKQKDEARRKEVVDHIQGIYEKTKSTVEKKLSSLDDEVGAIFDKGADDAVQRMKDYVETRFDERYSGLIGKGKWIKDKLLPLPPFVKAWFDEAYVAFQRDLDALVDRVANLVEQRLKEAKAEIDKGQAEIRTYVEGLPGDLKAVGQTAEKEVNSKFDELRQGVEDKKSSLAQGLAQKYKEAFDKGQAALKEMKDAHKSLYEKVKEAIEEVLKVLREFRDRVMNLLKKSKATIDLIVADPIQFLKNLLAAIKKGLSQFIDNIWKHLKAGFLQWMFGSLADAGIEIPSDFSIGSILKLVLSILGLTYARIRPKIVKIVGERGMVVLEKVFELIKALWEGGPAALWEKMKEYLGDLKQMVIDGIQEWLVGTIIKAAVTKLVSMFNPVGAIIQAILMIYNTVMFLVENIRRILEFVEAVINSALKIALGQIGDAANWIEQALARTVPIIIAFLARLLGISGLTDKIIGIVKKIQAKVDAAVDKVIAKIVGGIGKLIGAGKAAVKSVAKKIKDFIFPKLPFSAEGKTHHLTVDKTKPKLELVIQSASSPLAEYLYNMRSLLLESKYTPGAGETGIKSKKNLELYEYALKERKEAADALDKFYDPETGIFYPDKVGDGKWKMLLAAIREMWRRIGASEDLIEEEATVGTYKSGGGKDWTDHHVPQNGIMVRLKGWVKIYIERKHPPEWLEELGMRWQKIQGYTLDKGITIRMQKIRHGRTRTYGQLREELDVPRQTPEEEKKTIRERISEKHVSESRIKKFQEKVREQFMFDHTDVMAIYDGRKGIKRVKRLSKVEESMKELVKNNKREWGNFLKLP